tara:strand:- start:101 stop:460 length:360 start_codon:yes stop_codon:yes gene_type:complete
METDRLKNNMRFLSEFMGNRNIAAGMFRNLEKQYKTKIDYLNTQKNFLNKLNSLENEKNHKIKDNKQNLFEKKNNIHTNKRKLIYDQRDNRFYNRLFTILKMVLLILGITTIILLSKNN